MLLKGIHRAYLPDKILNLKDPGEPSEENWFPFLRDKGVPESPTVFVCREFTCLPPVQSEEELKNILG